MAGFQPSRRPVGMFDDSDDIDDWMAQRSADVAGRQDAEAAGREAWDQATQAGQDLSAPQPGDLARLGAQAMTGRATADSDGLNPDPNDSANASSDANAPVERDQPVNLDGPLLTPPRFGFSTARPGDSVSKLVGTSDPAAIGRFLSPNGLSDRGSTIYGGQRQQQDHRVAALRAQPTTSQSASSPSSKPVQADSEAARNDARWEGYRAGLLPGVLRGGIHAIQGVSGALTFGERLANPLADKFLSPPGHSASDQLVSAGAHLGLNIVGAVLGPSGAWQGALAFGRKVNAEVNPWGTPLPPTAAEARRAGEHLGENHGEILFNLASTPVGGEAGATLEGLRYASEAGDVAKYLRAGHAPDVATHLAKPYVQPGHHAWAKSRMLADFWGGGPLPTWLSESRLNLLHPRGIDIGQFYDLHARVDPNFYGAKLPGRGRGQGWSAKRLGIEKYDQLGQIWHGIPGYTKGLASGAILDLGDDLHSLFGGSQSQ
ncbi:MAG: hypothetical protein JWP86_130 [Phenylobacterium sp.]|nr:hypothetical protein [Phenylobacterium sp.]